LRIFGCTGVLSSFALNHHFAVEYWVASGYVALKKQFEMVEGFNSDLGLHFQELTARYLVVLKSRQSPVELLRVGIWKSLLPGHMLFSNSQKESVAL